MSPHSVVSFANLLITFIRRKGKEWRDACDNLWCFNLTINIDLSSPHQRMVYYVESESFKEEYKGKSGLMCVIAYRLTIGTKFQTFISVRYNIVNRQDLLRR